MLTKWLGLAVGLGALSACGQDSDARPQTAVALVVKTDLDTKSELRSVWVRVFAPDADIRRDPPLADFSPQPSDQLERPILIERGSSDEFLVAVQGLGAGGASDPILEQHLRVRFREGEVVAMPVHLSRGCLQKPCRAVADQTCYGERLGVACEGTCGPVLTFAPNQVVEGRHAPLLSSGWAPSLCRAAPTSQPACHGDACTAALVAEASAQPAVKTSALRVRGEGMPALMQQQLLRDLDRSASNLRLREGNGGPRFVEVTGGFKHATVVVAGPDGHFTGHCTGDAHTALTLGRSAQ